MIQTLTDAIKTRLDTLKGAGKPFVNVYAYHTLEQTGYPYACFELTNFEASIQDTCRNKRTFTFLIMILHDIRNGEGRGQAIESLVKAMDDTINLFDSDYTLGNSVTQVRPVSGGIEPFVGPSGKLLVGSINLEVETLNYIL